MRALATSLLVLGTVLGTLGGAHLPRADFRIVVAGLVLLAAGTIVLRRTRQSVPERARAHRDVLDALLAVPERVDALHREAPSLALTELCRRLERLDVDSIQPVAEASPELLSTLGAARFAAVFGAFASGERALARAWSAAADRHPTEALSALERAAERLHTAAKAAEP